MQSNRYRGRLRSSDAVRTAAKFLSLDISSAFLFTLHGKAQIGDEGNDGFLGYLVGIKPTVTLPSG